MISPDFIQIGFNKCGTTYFEKELYGKHHDINCLQIGRCGSLESLFISKFILPDALEFDRKMFEDEFKKQYISIRKKGKINGLIFESFTFLYGRRIDRKNIVDRLKRSFPSTKIIFPVRNQNSWLVSHYNQYIKSGGRLNFDAFIDQVLNNPFLDGYYIDWWPLISYINKSFPKNFYCIVYEQFEKDNQKTANQVYKFLGISNATVNLHRVNKSLKPNITKINRIINLFLKYDQGDSQYSYKRGDCRSNTPSIYKHKIRLLYKYYKPYLHRALSLINKIIPMGKRVNLDAKQMELVRIRYGKNNLSLQKFLNIDLKNMGYPVVK